MNSLTTRFSAGHLWVHIPDPVMMVIFIPLFNVFGLNAAASGMLVSGIVVFTLEHFLPRLQVLFPLEVTGVLWCCGG